MHRLQDYVHLVTPRKLLTARGAVLDGKADSELQGLTIDVHGSRILVRVDIVVMLGIGCNRQQPKRAL